MGKNKIYVGEHEINTIQSKVSGQFVEIDNEKYYQIKNYHEMPDFFISIVSDSDHWMFISSSGSLSAGRKDRDNALFPYYTVDKIHDYKGKTGSRTYFLITNKGKTSLWEPFTDESTKFYKITRNLYKNIYGNKIIFEEINSDLGLSFRYGWYNSEKFGFIKKSSITNLNNSSTTIEILDGIQNVLPYGVDYGFQNEYSNLLDAYKKSELVEGSTLGLFILSSIPIDRAEPSEALKATTVWSTGFGGKSRILLSDKQVNNFITGKRVKSELDIRATRGAYFINSRIKLAASGIKEWFTIAEINQDSTEVSNLNTFISETSRLEELVNEDVKLGTLNLKKIVAFADGFQMTNTDLCYARHYSNTLFNIMRGGVFVNNYYLDKNDFRFYLWQINRLLTKEYQSWLDNLPEKITNSALITLAENTGNADLLRIAYEYLPLTFSRRHGDPSRPWNIFSIETKMEDGRIKFYYAGNWRDIFQNWEALCYSFPEFIEGIISKFVNASTIDGYNPYRIMRDGIDWESPDPNDPWSYIGYWGDHQIIYLQKLLELSNNFHPGKLDSLLTAEIFTYANVPYRIKSYDEIYQNPKDTVVFDEALNKQIKTEVVHLGADARLLKNKAKDHIYRVNLTEKILVTLLSKLSNFIPEAGIWMNTQRPEWNDANNALVGNGASMVTLYYLRRFLKFWDDKLSDVSINNIEVSEEVAILLASIHKFFRKNMGRLDGSFSDVDRKNFADFLGQAHAKYRNEIYTYSYSGEKKQLQVKDLVDFIRITLKYIDHSILKNKRDDGLYHAYNLISLNADSISIRNLYEMLEGQVAVLSSGILSTRESLQVLDALKNSEMFRPDQYSYMLYPDRILPRFLEKNWIPEHLVEESRLLTKLLEDSETSIIQRDEAGEYHFNGTFRNVDALKHALDNLKIGSYSHLIELEKEKILAIYEDVFDHKSFTGRSGTFFGYEGLGSIYWHMVSKLLLATQECYFKAIDEDADAAITGQFEAHYYEIKAGIGLYKTPDLYGAFPTDAYSHTPSGAGVKQPGLTGQVKEDIISRLGELGIVISRGNIKFETSLLNMEEILQRPQNFDYYTIDGNYRRIFLKENQIGFTFCQVPIIYTFTSEDRIVVNYEDESFEEMQNVNLNQRISSLIFKRSGEVKLIEVYINKYKKKN
jgi:hypothetical protein